MNTAGIPVDKVPGYSALVILAAELPGPLLEQRRSHVYRVMDNLIERASQLPVGSGEKATAAPDHLIESVDWASVISDGNISLIEELEIYWAIDVLEILDDVLWAVPWHGHPTTQ